ERRRVLLRGMVGAKLLVTFVNPGVRSDALEQRFHLRPRELAPEVRLRRGIVEVAQPRECVARGCEAGQGKGDEVALRRSDLLIQIELPPLRGRRCSAQELLLGL